MVKCSSEALNEKHSGSKIALARHSDIELTNEALRKLREWMCDQARLIGDEFELITANSFLRKFMRQQLEAEFSGLQVVLKAVGGEPRVRTMWVHRFKERPPWRRSRSPSQTAPWRRSRSPPQPAPPRRSRSWRQHHAETAPRQSSRPPRNHHAKTAYVIFLWGTDPNYILEAMMVGYCLRKTSTFKMIAFVSAEVLLKDGKHWDGKTFKFILGTQRV